MPIKPTKSIKPILLMGFVLLLAACGGGPRQQGATTDTVTDDYGRLIVVPSHPQRVVSLSPAVTEIMFALGAQDLLVGRTDFCEYPPEAAQIPSIGGISNLNIERILSLQPDLVISGSMVGKKVTDQMDQMGTPMVCVIEKPRFDALYDNIRAIAHLVGRDREADSLCNALASRCSGELGMMSDELASASNDSSHITHHSSLSPKANDSSLITHHSSLLPKVYYVVGFGPTGNFTAGGNTFINDIISMAGGRNIAADVSGWSYSLEALVGEDPDYIIVRREDSAAFCSMKPYNRLRAVREGHVIGIVSGTLDLQVPRNIDAILYLRQRMEKKE